MWWCIWYERMTAVLLRCVKGNFGGNNEAITVQCKKMEDEWLTFSLHLGAVVDVCVWMCKCCRICVLLYLQNEQLPCTSALTWLFGARFVSYEARHLTNYQLICLFLLCSLLHLLHTYSNCISYKLLYFTLLNSRLLHPHVIYSIHHLHTI